MALHDQRYYAKHRDIISERMKKYYIANRDIIREKQKKYYQKMKGQYAYVRAFPPKWRGLTAEPPPVDFNMDFN